MRVRLRIQQRHELPCASSKFQGIGCSMICDELEVVEKLLEEEMLVGSSNHLVKVMLMRSTRLEALEMEALVDVMDVDNG
ncbi:hypothetical protein Tco_0097169 [Tanacetum coccineum]